MKSKKNAQFFLDEELYGSPDTILKVLHMVREALIELVASTGADPTKTRDTARRLDLSINLVWPVSRFINADDILTASSEVLDRIKFEKICDACEAKGAPPDLVQQARLAIERFEEVVARSTGDRQSFSLMLTGLGYKDVTQRQESIRKMAFLSNSSLWGVQSRLSFKTVILLPNVEDPTMMDAIRIFGMVDFRRLRSMSWPLYRMHSYNDDGTIQNEDCVPLEPLVDGMNSIPFVKEFCSSPLPNLFPIKRDSVLCFDLAEGPIGNAGLLTCVIADRLVKGQPIYRVPGKHEFVSGLFDVITPLEQMLFDVYAHQDLKFFVPPQCTLLDRMTTPSGFNPRDLLVRYLPLSNQVLSLGKGLTGVATGHYPRYAQLLDYIFDRAGIDSNKFHGFRLSLRYPQITTAVHLKWKLHERPVE